MSGYWKAEFTAVILPLKRSAAEELDRPLLLRFLALLAETVNLVAMRIEYRHLDALRGLRVQIKGARDVLLTAVTYWWSI